MGRPGNKKMMSPPKADAEGVIAAGTVANTHPVTAKACFDWDYFIPFYKRTLLEPIPDLKIRKHISVEEEKIKQLTHGVRMGSKDSAADVLAPSPQNPLLVELEHLREKNYHRKEHHPLGRSSCTKLPLPSFTNEKDFRFGDHTQFDESVAQIMYPKEQEKEDPEVYRKYVLSHGSYKPGEQKRHYGKDWSPPEYKESVEHKRLENDGSRVHDALYWKDNRLRELEQKIITAELARFHDRHQPEIGKVFDPMKSTLAHLPVDHTFGIKEPEGNSIHVSHLMGNSSHVVKAKSLETKKWKLPPAGLQTYRTDDLDLQKTIIPCLGPLEDALLVRKITEDNVGGTVSTIRPNNPFGDSHVYGVPTVRDPAGRVGKVKRLADQTNYGDELEAKGLMYPTPRNVYGRQQILLFEQHLREQAKVAA